MLRGRTGTGVVIWGDWKQFHGHPFSAHPNLLEKRTKKMQERKTGSNKETEERAVALVRRERTGVQGVLTQRHQARSLRADLLGARLLTSVTYEGRDVTAGRSGWG